jgi:hypothetical protein
MRAALADPSAAAPYANQHAATPAARHAAVALEMRAAGVRQTFTSVLAVAKTARGCAATNAIRALQRAPAASHTSVAASVAPELIRFATAAAK